MVRIEIFGLCGAGKSTLFKVLVPRINRAGSGQIDIDPPVQPNASSIRLELAKLMARLAWQSPSDFLSWRRGQAGTSLVKKLAYRLAGIRTRRRLGPSLLIDSGLLQPFVSFAIEVNRERRCYPLDSLLRTLPMPTLAFYVKTFTEVAFSRYLDRGPLTAEPPEVLRERFDDGLGVCEWLLKGCEDNGTAVTVIDVNDAVESHVLDQVVTEIMAHPQILAGGNSR